MANKNHTLNLDRRELLSAASASRVGADNGDGKIESGNDEDSAVSGHIDSAPKGEPQHPPEISTESQ